MTLPGVCLPLRTSQSELPSVIYKLLPVITSLLQALPRRWRLRREAVYADCNGGISPRRRYRSRSLAGS